MKYFKNIDTLEKLRKQYKELLKVFHPDAPKGSTEITQEINAEYDRIFKDLKSNNFNGEKEQSDFNNMKYDFTEDANLREVLQKIICFEGIKIEIIGCWIWIDGNTYELKYILKELGFKWAREKKKWYFHTDAFRKKSYKKLSLKDIRKYYGSTEVETEKKQLIY